VDFDFTLELFFQFAVTDGLLVDGFAGVTLSGLLLTDFIALGESSLDKDEFTFPSTLRLRYWRDCPLGSLCCKYSPAEYCGGYLHLFET
jgi:hypothetical protein